MVHKITTIKCVTIDVETRSAEILASILDADTDIVIKIYEQESFIPAIPSSFIEPEIPKNKNWMRFNQAPKVARK